MSIFFFTLNCEVLKFGDELIWVDGIKFWQKKQVCTLPFEPVVDWKNTNDFYNKILMA